MQYPQLKNITNIFYLRLYPILFPYPQLLACPLFLSLEEYYEYLLLEVVSYFIPLSTTISLSLVFVPCPLFLTPTCPLFLTLLVPCF